MDLFSRYCGRVGCTPQRTSSTWSRDSTLLQGKQPTKTPLKICARSNGGIKSYRPFETVLWSRRWYAPTDVVGVQQRFHATRRKTAYGKSSKNLSAIQLSDLKLWTFSAGTLVAMVVRPERSSSAWSRESTPLKRKQPMKTPRKI